MTDLFEVPAHVRNGSRNAVQSPDDWREAWMDARDRPNAFWLEEAQRSIAWRQAPTKGLEGSFHSIADQPLRWFADGTLNVTESCLDRHALDQPDKTAILWEGDEPGDVRRISYAELLNSVGQAANTLRGMGIGPGDRVLIYMGMVPEAAIAMLATARIGAVHSVVFGGFSAEALRDRVLDCGACAMITQDEGMRGGRRIPLKATVEEAWSLLGRRLPTLMHERTSAEIPWDPRTDTSWSATVPHASSECPATVLDAEDPLFILYTSGSTGKPKGVVHTCGGYITYAAYTHRTVFDLRDDDVYACVADVGWITGHTYIVYGPLANGATTFMFESVPTYPDAGRYWDMVERHGITVFYTAPTALRALAAQGNAVVERHDRSSLRVLGTVGEPINPEAWDWYREVVGSSQCTIVDTWWQTETGGIMISPIAPATPVAAGSATLPLPGVQPVLVTPEGERIIGPGEGLLCMAHPWPGMARTVWGDHERFFSTYFAQFPGLYFTGDGCRRDPKGYHWITGRVDDVLNVSGHRMGTAEFEAALVSHPAVAEAGVVGFPHPIKGEGVYAYIVLQAGEDWSETTHDELNRTCRTRIGAHARIDLFQHVPGLPKTRSGKVMRRILRKVATGEGDSLGDVSTLADPDVVALICQGFRTLEATS